MAGGKITYNIGFNVDSSSLKSVQQELQKIANLTPEQLMLINPNSFKTMQDATKEIENIKHAAEDMVAVLQKNYNINLDTYDLKKLNQELDKSPELLQRTQIALNKMGADGRIQFNNLTKELLTANTQVRQTTKLVDSLGQTFANTIKWSISSSILNSFTGFLQSAWGYAKKLDTSLNDIRIVTSKSADDMERFAKEANKAAKGLGASTTSYTNASLIYYQQGLSDKDVKARTDVTLKAANVTGQSAAEVSEQLTAVWNGYKVVAEEAELYVDKLAAVAATTAADLEELSTGMQKVASAASTMGVDIDQLSAQLATIVSVTRQDASLVGTALKTIYARMGDLKVDGVDEFGTSLGDVSGQMRQMGIDVLDQQGNLRDMGDVITEVAAKWQTWTDAQQQAAAVAMAGKRQYNNLIALFENWDMYESALATSQGAEGTLQKQQETYMDSLEFHLEQLSTTAQKFYDALIDNDAFKGFIDLASGFVDVLGDITAGVGGLIPMIISLGGVLGKIFNAQLTKGLRSLGHNLKLGFGVVGEAFGRTPSQDKAKQAITEKFGTTIKSGSNMTLFEAGDFEGLKQSLTDKKTFLSESEQKKYDKTIAQINSLQSHQQVLTNQEAKVNSHASNLTKLLERQSEIDIPSLANKSQGISENLRMPWKYLKRKGIKPDNWSDPDTLQKLKGLRKQRNNKQGEGQDQRSQNYVADSVKQLDSVIAFKEWEIEASKIIPEETLQKANEEFKKNGKGKQWIKSVSGSLNVEDYEKRIIKEEENLDNAQKKLEFLKEKQEKKIAANKTVISQSLSELPQVASEKATQQAVSIQEDRLKYSRYLTEEQQAQYDLATKETLELANQLELIEKKKAKEQATIKALEEKAKATKWFTKTDLASDDFEIIAQAKADEIKSAAEAFKKSDLINQTITYFDPGENGSASLLEGVFQEESDKLEIRNNGEKGYSKLKDMSVKAIRQKMDNAKETKIETDPETNTKTEKKTHTDKSMAWAAIADLKALEEQAEKVVPTQTEAYKVLQLQKDKFYKGEISAKAYIDAMSAAMDRTSKEAEELGKKLPVARQQVGALGDESAETEQKVDGVRQKIDQLNQQNEKGMKINGWVEIGTAIMGVVGACMSLANIFNVLQDESLSTPEKIKQVIAAVLGAITAAIPAITSILSMLQAKVTASLGWIGLILAAVSAITALTIAILTMPAPKSNLEKANEQLERAEETAKKAQQRVNELTTAYSNLKSEVQDIKDARRALDTMRKGTEEWQASVNDLNLSVLSLLEKYPQLLSMEGVGFNSNLGVWEISDEAYTNLFASLQSQQTQSMIALQRAAINKGETERDQILAQASNEIGVLLAGARGVYESETENGQQWTIKGKNWNPAKNILTYSDPADAGGKFQDFLQNGLGFEVNDNKSQATIKVTEETLAKWEELNSPSTSTSSQTITSSGATPELRDETNEVAKNVITALKDTADGSGNMAARLDSVGAAFDTANTALDKNTEALDKNSEVLWQFVAQDDGGVQDVELFGNVLNYTEDAQESKPDGGIQKTKVINDLQDTKRGKEHDYSNLTDVEKEINFIDLTNKNKIHYKNEQGDTETLAVGNTINNMNDLNALQSALKHLLKLAYGDRAGEYEIGGLQEILANKVKTNSLPLQEITLKHEPTNTTETLTIQELQQRAAAGTYESDIKKDAGATKTAIQKQEEAGYSSKGGLFTTSTEYSNQDILNELWTSATVADVESVVAGLDNQGQLGAASEASNFQKYLEGEIKARMGEEEYDEWMQYFTTDDADNYAMNKNRLESISEGASDALFGGLKETPQLLHQVSTLMSKYDITTVSGMNDFLLALHTANIDISALGDEWQGVVKEVRSGMKQWIQDMEGVIENLQFINSTLKDISLGDIVSKEEYEQLIRIAPELARYYVETDQGYVATLSGYEQSKIAKSQYSDLGEIKSTFDILNGAKEVKGDDKLTEEMLDSTQEADLIKKLRSLVPTDTEKRKEYLEAAGFTKQQQDILNGALDNNSVADDELDIIRSAIQVLNQIALDRESGRFSPTKAQTYYQTGVLTSWDEVTEKYSKKEGEESAGTSQDGASGTSSYAQKDITDETIGYYGTQFLKELDFAFLGSGVDLDIDKVNQLNKLAKAYRVTELEYLKELDQQIERTFGADRVALLQARIDTLDTVEVKFYNNLLETALDQNREQYINDEIYNADQETWSREAILSKMITIDDKESDEYKQYESLLKAYDARTDASWKLVDYQIEAFTVGYDMVKEFQEFEQKWSKRMREIDNIDFSELTAFATDFTREFKTLLENVRDTSTQFPTAWQDAINKTRELISYSKSNNSDNPFWNETTGTLDTAALKTQLESSMDDLYSVYEDLFNVHKELYDSVMSAGEEVSAMYEDQISKLNNVNSLLQSGLELYMLLGKRATSAQSDVSLFTDSMIDNIHLSVEYAKAEWKAAKDLYEEAKSTGDSEAIASTAEAFTNTMANSVSVLTEALNTIVETFGIRLEAIINEVIGDFGLEGFNQAWELEKAYDSAYLDSTNTEYAMYNFHHQVQKSIDETDNMVAQNRLIQMRAEQEAKLNRILEERGKISQHDIDLANAEYELTLKQIALEEAQQTADKLKLTRDAFGNYSYTYVADENKIADAAAEVKAAENELYNLRKEHEKTLIDSFSTYMSEYQTKRAEAVAAGNEELIEALDEKYLGPNGLLTNLQKEVLDLDKTTGLFTTQLATINNINFDTLKNSITSLTDEIQMELEEIYGALDGLFGEDGDLLTGAKTLTTQVKNNLNEINNKAQSVIDSFSSSVTQLSNAASALDLAAGLLQEILTEGSAIIRNLTFGTDLQIDIVNIPTENDATKVSENAPTGAPENASETKTGDPTSANKEGAVETPIKVTLNVTEFLNAINDSLSGHITTLTNSLTITELQTSINANKEALNTNTTALQTLDSTLKNLTITGTDTDGDGTPDTFTAQLNALQYDSRS